MPSEVEVTATPAGFTTLVAVRGELDIRSRAAFAESVLPVAMSADRVVLDLTEVSFIDSTGIGELVRVRRTLQHRGQGMHVVPSRRVLSALTISSILGTMIIHDTVSDALLDGDVADPAPSDAVSST